MNSYKKKQSTLEEQEKQERLRLKRKEWFIQQELERKHQERKLKMIEEYEKKRAETIKIDKSRFVQQIKNNDRQRRKISYGYEHAKKWKASMIFKGPEDIIINEKELHNIKIKINNKGNLLIKDRNMSKEIERDIINPDDIILPRRSNEGSCPIFERNKKKNVEDIQTIKFSQDKQTEKSSTSEKNAHTYKTNLGYDLVTQRYGLHVPTRRIYQTDDDDRQKHDRWQNSSIRDNKKKDGNERRVRNSYYSSRSVSTRNRSKSQCRSRNLSPINERTKERREDNDKNKFSSKENSSHLRESKNHMFPISFTKYSPSHSYYNSYMVHLPRPMPMPTRIQAPPIVMPVLSELIPASFPPMNIYWHQFSPRFVSGRGSNHIHNPH